MNKPNKLVDRVDRAIALVADWSIRHRWLVLAMTAALVFAGLYSASTVRVDQSIDSFFYKDDPSYGAYQNYLEDFVSDEVAYLMYSAKKTEHGPFDLEVMRTIANLSEALATEVPFVRKATSLANVEFMRSVGDNDIVIDDLLIDFPESQAAMLEIKDLVMSKPFYTNFIVSKDATHAAIILQMEVSSAQSLDKIIHDPNLGSGTDNLYPIVSDRAIREILARPEFADQGIEYHISGDVPMVTTYQEMMIEDTILVTLVSLILILIVGAILFNATLVGIVGPLTVVFVSITLTIGLIGAIGWEINNFFTMLPTLLLAVGIAQSVHIILEYQRQLSINGDRNTAIKAALSKVGGPCLMAALTTAAGFYVMVISDLRIMAEFAVYAAFGILATFFFSATLLVGLLSEKPKANTIELPSSPKQKLQINRYVVALVEHCITLNLRHGKTILGIFAVAFAVAFIGLSKLQNDFSFLHEFKPHVEWRVQTEKVESEMGGTLRMSYLIDTGEPDGIKRPELLKHIEKLQAFAETNPVVVKTQSLADTMKDLNRTFHGDDPAYFRIPDERELLAQYFLVYEMSGGEELDEFVSYDNSRTVVEFLITMSYASDVRGLTQQIDKYLLQNPLPNATGQLTGIGLLWVKLTEYITKTQVQSYTLVFIMIAFFMCLAFGSIKLGVLSMIPNLTPVILAMGALGWTGTPLDYMKLLLATIAIGIAVDDTIHLVTRTRSRFFETGNYVQALTLGLRDVGPALVITSTILVIGFAGFLLSNTTIMANFGILLGGTITAALLADLFLMPLLILKTKPFGDEFEPNA